MRTLLIVSPHFPPINAPDMHRVRMSLPYYKEFGWRPVVLAVEPAYVEGVEEPLLLETIPSDVPIRRVAALPVRLTRKVVGDLGLRALPFLYWTGAQMIKRYNIDLVYFSTTVFQTLVLARIWKEQLGVRFVLDLQDSWLSSYYEDKPKSERPPKYWFVQRMNKVLEPWVVRKVDGIIAVSEAYHVNLRKRYPWILPEVCRTIPFGASSLDYEVATKFNGENPYFRRGDGFIHGMYGGVLGSVMKQTCVAICLAFQQGLRRYPALFSKVRLHFIGTSYAMDSRAAKTIQPVATEMGLADYVQEDPCRIPYFAVLNFLKDADFLLVPGSDNPRYTASKIYPYILAQKPLLAVFHERSSVIDVLRSTQAGELATFSSDSDVESIASSLLSQWIMLLRRLPFKPSTNWQAFQPYTAREMSRRQCELFDCVVNAKPSLCGNGPENFSISGFG